MFDIPVVLIIFKRLKVLEIINRLRELKPKKVYILADNGRNDEEISECQKCRELVETSLDWNCEIIKNYADTNRGVYANIGLGARWVFEREETAIFLEDDNLPELTFFEFCKEMLSKYNDNEKILWVCGTNYLGKTHFKDGASYTFTRHMLPCGWASWSNKFLKYYDGELTACREDGNIQIAKSRYYSKRVANQYAENWLNEYKKINEGDRPSSWDYQMDFSIKFNNLLGIAPVFNQIKNIGVDNFSAHGGNSFDNIMVKRFCGMNSYPLKYPLIDPKNIKPDIKFEKRINRIIAVPYRYTLKIKLRKIVVKILGFDENESIRARFRRK